MILKLKYVFIAFLLLGWACKNDKRYLSHEEVNGFQITDSTDVVQDVKAFQAELNEEYKNPDTSPLADKDRKKFVALDFFEIDTTYRVEARFEETPFENSFYMQTTTDRAPEYKRFGIVYFTLKGKEYQLNVYQSQELKLQDEYKDYLFIPFLDDTNGDESYGGGRYLDATIPDGDKMIIDFNKAYNPYCAYNKKYSCPVVPQENRLDVAIKAGVKKFH
ncbi:hypothetical protein SAMN05216480_101860 [Pustulibacterium marinum]|uniref:DUF1684 domain-containing protein n=1 Tax=Pustulibacterium marinum TaxID=1224947 RepID=A0A1I7FCT9_9FLAO|nr:DUF1684 domain-containing protein [Pustulibacterium marinum]SFU33978.1 hypothetical protein SAMN05216480_101860 [Pustulibacterium marinum]